MRDLVNLKLSKLVKDLIELTVQRGEALLLLAGLNVFAYPPVPPGVSKGSPPASRGASFGSLQECEEEADMHSDAEAELSLITMVGRPRAE